jgi:hypothetical protein
VLKLAALLGSAAHLCMHNEAVRAGILCTTIVCTLMFPFTTLLPVFARDLLSVGAEGQGLLLAAMGIVGALGIVIPVWLMPRARQIK